MKRLFGLAALILFAVAGQASAQFVSVSVGGFGGFSSPFAVRQRIVTPFVQTSAFVAAPVFASPVLAVSDCHAQAFQAFAVAPVVHSFLAPAVVQRVVVQRQVVQRVVVVQRTVIRQRVFHH